MTFTDKKPTVPGDYIWWKSPATEAIYVKIVLPSHGKLVMKNGGFVKDMPGLWSSRLVPADEYVKKEEVINAWNEAVVGDTPWHNSRARRVVEGGNDE